MPKNKLYISDLDGTLLDDDARLSSYAFKNLTRMIESGLNFTIASARSIVSIKEILKGLPISLPVIEINGALISDMQTGEHHIINAIDKPTVEGIHSIVVDNGCMPFISSFDGNADNLYYEKAVNDGMSLFLGDGTEDHAKRIRHIGDITNAFDEEVVCITIIDRYEKMIKLADRVNAAFDGQLENYFFENPYFDDWFWLTIHDKKANKAIAVKELAEWTNFDIEDIVVFGDNINDVEMMQLNAEGAYSVAVANALDNIKESANEVIAANVEDGVVKYLENVERSI